MFKIQTVLHPTDFSEPSKRALHFAASLARDHEAQLVILHVTATLGAELVTFGEAASELEPESHQARLMSELRQVKPADPEIPVAYRLAEGDPAEQILLIAREVEAGLIVMGTHGRTGLDRLLMGSVAEQIVRKASCPVLTVKATPQP